MKKAIRNILVILVVFAASLTFFSWQINRKEPVTETSSDNPTLPVVCMEVGGIRANEMYGVKQQLDESMLRDSLTPLPSDRNLTISVDPSGRTINGISYQVTEPGSGTLIENGQITGLAKDDDGYLTGTFRFQGNIRSDREYTLRFSLDTGDNEPVYYYTRLVQGAGTDISDYFTFAENFRDMCLNKLEADNLDTYLETDDTSSNRSFSDVNIHSSSDMVSWGNLSPQMTKEAPPVIKELNSVTGTLELDYIISAENSTSQTEYYLVHDFYRLGHLSGGTEVSLLSFSRHASQIFDGSISVQTDTGLDLGVRSQNDVVLKSSPDGDRAAFAVNGDLWSYDDNSGALVKIFGFRGIPGGNTFDDRTELTRHDITIEQVTENGDIDFVVYGYMSSGRHEGEMGVSVCSYTAASGTTEEKTFIPLAQSYEGLHQNISKLSYVNNSSALYLFLGSQLCCINMTDGSYSIVEDSIPSGAFVSSDSQKTVAWLNGSNDGTATRAVMMDLSTGTRSEITAPDGEGITACGFLNEDFVYGLVKSSDVITDEDGHADFGIYRLLVQSIDGDIRKDYTPSEDSLITDIEQDSGNLKLTLSQKSGDGYSEKGTDRIVSNEESAAAVTLDTQVYERTGEKVLLVFPEPASGIDVHSSSAAMASAASDPETVLEWPVQSLTGYYVYGQEGLAGFYAYANSAIEAADAVSGIVLNQNQQYVWERGAWGSSYTIDVASLPSAVLNAGFDENALASATGDNYTVLNLTGITQEDLKYMIYNGSPVLAVGDNQVYCIIGYDEYNIWVYDASTGKPRAIASDDSEAEFKKHGNSFLSYQSK